MPDLALHGRRRPTLVIAIVLVLLALLATEARSEWIGPYLPLYADNSWTYENVNVPGDFMVESVFDTTLWNGLVCAVFGQADDHQVIHNTGRVITVFALFDEDTLYPVDPPIVLGDVHDGSLFEVPGESVPDTNLIRDWEAIDPALRALYGLDAAWDDVLLIVAFDREENPNLHNTVVISNLPAGAPVPTGGVTSLEWYQRRLGMVAEADVEAETGGLGDFYQLIDWVVPVADGPPVACLAWLAPCQPNPSNPATTLRYTLTAPARVTLALHDLRGRLVRTLVHDVPQSAGSHAALWDGDDDGGRPVPSGVYLVRLQAGATGDRGRLVLVR